MSYGQCASCPTAVAAWSLSAAAMEALPEAALLCVEHLALLLKLRQDAARRAERQGLRRWCVGLPWDSCGRELYLDHAVCTWCRLGQPRSTSVPAGHIPIRSCTDWYTVDVCQGLLYADGDVSVGSEECSAKKTYRMPNGRIFCDKHGAGQATEDKIYS